jgi:hypothetical protein
VVANARTIKPSEDPDALTIEGYIAEPVTGALGERPAPMVASISWDSRGAAVIPAAHLAPLRPV